jgi:hypothetical protein
MHRRMRRKMRWREWSWRRRIAVGIWIPVAIAVFALCTGPNRASGNAAPGTSDGSVGLSTSRRGLSLFDAAGIFGSAKLSSAARSGIRKEHADRLARVLAGRRAISQHRLKNPVSTYSQGRFAAANRSVLRQRFSNGPMYSVEQRRFAAASRRFVQRRHLFR